MTKKEFEFQYPYKERDFLWIEEKEGIDNLRSTIIKIKLERYYVTVNTERDLEIKLQGIKLIDNSPILLSLSNVLCKAENLYSSFMSDFLNN
jgi:hypothetical protein